MRYFGATMHFMNDGIDSLELGSIVKNKKNKLKNNQYLMNIEGLKAFCKDKTALKVK